MITERKTGLLHIFSESPHEICLIITMRLPFIKLLLRIARKNKILFISYIIAEAYNYLRFALRRRWLGTYPSGGMSTRFNRKRYLAYFRQELERHPNPTKLLEGVFQSPLQKISRQRALHFLAVYASAEECKKRMSEAQMMEARALLHVLEKRGAFRLHSDGCDEALALPPSNTRAQCPESRTPAFSRVGAFSINAWYKPLALKGIMWLVRLYTERNLRGMGFRRKTAPHSIVYWYRPASGRSRKAPTLFFFHGIGFGVVPYERFLRRLVESLGSGRDIIACEWPNISHGWSDNYCADELPTSQEYADGIYILAKKHSPDAPIDVIGHSFGSAVINYVHAHHPEILRRRVYMDPIVFFASFQTYVGFSYEHFFDSISSLIREAMTKPAPLRFAFREWFVKTDLSVQQLTKCSSYVWETWPCFPGQRALTSDSLFYLSGLDPVVDSPSVRSYLETFAPEANIIYSESFVHGGFLFQNDKDNTLHQLVDFLRVKGSDGASTKIRRVRSQPQLSMRSTLIF